jgi:hypothetical protein
VPTDLHVRATLSRGSLDGQPPQYTQQVRGVFGSLTPWTTACDVPRYAKSFVPFGSNAASADLLFAATNYWVFYANNPGAAATAGLVGIIRAQDALQYMGGAGIPIPNNARKVAFINGVAGNMDARLVFNLCT